MGAWLAMNAQFVALSQPIFKVTNESLIEIAAIAWAFLFKRTLKKFLRNRNSVAAKIKEVIGKKREPIVLLNVVGT